MKILHFELESFESKQKPPRKPITSFLLKCECKFNINNALYNKLKIK